MKHLTLKAQSLENKKIRCLRQTEKLERSYKPFRISKNDFSTNSLKKDTLNTNIELIMGIPPPGHVPISVSRQQVRSHHDRLKSASSQRRSNSNQISEAPTTYTPYIHDMKSFMPTPQPNPIQRQIQNSFSNRDLKFQSPFTSNRVSMDPDFNQKQVYNNQSTPKIKSSPIQRRLMTAFTSQRSTVYQQYGQPYSSNIELEHMYETETTTQEKDTLRKFKFGKDLFPQYDTQQIQQPDSASNNIGSEDHLEQSMMKVLSQEPICEFKMLKSSYSTKDFYQGKSTFHNNEEKSQILKKMNFEFYDEINKKREAIKNKRIFIVNKSNSKVKINFIKKNMLGRIKESMRSDETQSFN